MRLIKDKPICLGIFQSILISIILLVSPSSQAAQEVREVGLKLGMVNVEGSIGTVVLLGGTIDLGRITPNLQLEGGLEFWHKGYDCSPELGYSYTDFGIDATVKHYFPLPESSLKPYCGGGLGIHILRRNFHWCASQLPPSHLHNYTSNELVLHITGGAEYPLGSNLTGFGELKYSTGGWDYFGLLLGLKFGLPSK